MDANAPQDAPGFPGGPRAALLATSDPTRWRRLAAQLETALQSSPAPRPLRLALLSTHGSDLLAQLLPPAAACVEIRLETALYAHRPPEQTLLTDDALAAFAPDHALLSGTYEDLMLDPAHAARSVAEAVARWSGLWPRVRERFGCRVVQTLFVPPADDPGAQASLLETDSLTSMVRTVNAGLRAAAAGRDDVLLVDCEWVAAREGTARWRDPRHWSLFRQPVAMSALPELAKAVVGVLASDAGTARRCVVVDLDNTLWDGVVGEDGIDGVAIDGGGDGDGYRSFQRYLLGLRKRGVALAVASKNDPDLAATALARVPGMVLRPEHFAAVVAGWQPKSAQLRALSRRLRLGTGSMVFVDDNPAECAEVAGQLPEVDVVWLHGGPAEYAGLLCGRPTLATALRTREDGLRNASYTALARAERHREAAASPAEFLAGLDMVADVRPLDGNDLPRAVQLAQRTNQFTLTTRRYDRPALERYTHAPDWDCLTLRLRDRYGDHGLVGLLVQHRGPDAAEIDGLMLSCRVIGRTAERRLLHEAAALAAKSGLRRMRGTYLPSGRNTVVADLYPELGFTPVAGSPGTFDLVLSPLTRLDTPHIASTP